MKWPLTVHNVSPLSRERRHRMLPFLLLACPLLVGRYGILGTSSNIEVGCAARCDYLLELRRHEDHDAAQLFNCTRMSEDGPRVRSDEEADVVLSRLEDMLRIREAREDAIECGEERVLTSATAHAHQSQPGVGPVSRRHGDISEQGVNHLVTSPMLTRHLLDFVPCDRRRDYGELAAVVRS